jgi:cytochrome d ubiquinol oxidase subunit I
MDAVDLARWQFAITTVYHFLFVPLTIGLSLLVAVLQTRWYRTGRPEYLRATKFWGKLFLINFAMGVVTGIVQEFQFGMNWSDYSRFVGDIFGAPLAIEGLLAFFLESTFLGLWIFGWDRLPKRIHLATIWLASIGTVLSAYFILAANSWMQHPVGYTINPETNRAELTDFVAVLTNSTTLVAFPHTLTACLLTAGAFMLAVSGWHLARNPRRHGATADRAVFVPSMKLALWVVVISGALVAITGDLQARIMTEQQPMKMAAAEALYNTAGPASFSLLTIGSLDGSQELWSLRVPGLLSFMATGSLDGEVEGINDLQTQYALLYGPGDYSPNIATTYWSFRLMIGLGLLVAAFGLVGLWLTRKRRLQHPQVAVAGVEGRALRWFWRLAPWMFALPLLANTFGWIFTELGRQPWTVFGMLRTADSVSPEVGVGSVVISLAVFTVLYGVLAAVEGYLMVRFAKAGPAPVEAAAGQDEDATDPDRPLTFAY